LNGTILNKPNRQSGNPFNGSDVDVDGSSHVGCGWIQFPAEVARFENQFPAEVARFENFLVCNFGFDPDAASSPCQKEDVEEEIITYYRYLLMYSKLPEASFYLRMNFDPVHSLETKFTPGGQLLHPWG
jgi:hypothetical protein